jgi:hypothetical protein
MVQLVRIPKLLNLASLNVAKESLESYLIENHKFDLDVYCLNPHAIPRLCAEDSGLISHELPMAEKTRSTA